MTLKKYILTMVITTTICWMGFVFVVTTINPEITNWIGFMLFYLSLFLSLIGTSAIFGFTIRFIMMKQKLAFKIVADAFRQSFFLSFLVVASLFLISKELFTWLNLLSLVFTLSALEFFLINIKKGA